MADDNRRTSIYDLTGLRVHPDGFRVHQTQRNLRLGTQQRYYNSQDFRGWIANGAGGSVITPKYRRNSQTASSDAEDLESLVEAECSSGESSEKIVSSAKGKRKDTSNTRRALKRKKFAEDDSYISQMPETSSGTPRLPSQDLLKNIHCLAANYYDQNGLLINASKRYRKARKLRKLNRVSSEPALTGAQINEDKEIDSAEQVAVQDSSVQQQRNRDMYRVLDGSVLVAIGVFTEEIVKKLLQGRKRNTHQQFEDASLDDEAGDRSDFDDRPCNEWDLQQQSYQ